MKTARELVKWAKDYALISGPTTPEEMQACAYAIIEKIQRDAWEDGFGRGECYATELEMAGMCDKPKFPGDK